MSRFVTLASGGKPDAKIPVLLWEEKDSGPPQICGRYSSFDEVPGGPQLEVYRFELPTTAEYGSTVNQGHYPVLDADGAPLWSGAKIRFVVPTHYINTTSGTGVLKHVDSYGGCYFEADREMNVYGRGGVIADCRRAQYAAVSEYHFRGDFEGCRTLAGKIGDPHEHGSEKTFIRLNEDPRSVCKLVRAPDNAVEAAPGAGLGR